VSQKNQRALTDVEANTLGAGDAHYRAYVGPPSQYDLIGASQFNLLCALGLRERHKVLDFGCGSLRLGRLLIPFLREGGYYGIEPNTWLIDDAVARQVTTAVIALKQPTFLNNADFNAARAGRDFDFIVAQSIFSHAGLDIIETALKGFYEALSDSGLAAVTVIHSGAPESAIGWIYPECVAHSAEAFDAAVAASGLFGRRIPWFHPRQNWHVLAKRADRLPPDRHDQYLTGAILNEPDWVESLAAPEKIKRS
jgi:SAM-dependent methyltransferase